jgi:hypothetical protein
MFPKPSSAHEAATAAAAGHASALVVEAERYLEAVAAFDSEGFPPFGAVRERAAQDRGLGGTCRGLASARTGSRRKDSRRAT